MCRKNVNIAHLFLFIGNMNFKNACNKFKLNIVFKQVVCALLSLKPIVTPEYMDHYVKHLKGKDEKPNPDL